MQCRLKIKFATTCTALLFKLIWLFISLMVLMLNNAIFIDVSIIVRNGFSMVFECVCWVHGNDADDLLRTLFFVAVHTHCIILLWILNILISKYNIRFIDVIGIIPFQFCHNLGFGVDKSIRLPEVGRKHPARR